MRRYKRRLLLLAGLPLYTAFLMAVTTLGATLLIDPADAVDVAIDLLGPPTEAAWWGWRPC